MRQVLLLFVLTLTCAAQLGSCSDAEGHPQVSLTPQVIGRVLAVAAGELAKDPEGAARSLRTAMLRSRAEGTFNELSPECGVVFSSLLSTVLALVGGVDLPEYMEFIKWLDSVAKPEAGILLGNTKWIGSREECESLRLPIYQDPNNASSLMYRTSGRYCTFKVNSTRSGGPPVLDGAPFGGDIGAMLQTYLELAICMPNPCKGRDAEIATNYVIQFILGFIGPILQGIPGLGGIVDTLKSFRLAVQGCSVTSQEVGSELEWGAIAMIVLTVVPVAVILASTAVTGIIDCRRGIENEGRLRKIGRAFCLRSNLRKLFAPPVTDSLACLNGIRVLSIFWVILGHTLLILALISVLDNPVQLLDDFRKRWQSVLVINATTSVDSFFLLSGTLVAFGFFSKVRPSNKVEAMRTLRSGKFWLLYYFHRYWRLTPPLMFYVFWQLGLFRYFGNGALLPKDRVMFDNAACQKHWWTLPLYVQNFVGVSESCMGHTWYLANDMQMYLISPIMLLPFFFGGLAVGSVVTVVVVGLSMWLTGFLNSHYGFRRGHLNFVPGQLDGYDPNTSYYDIIYIKPYCRIGAYSIGILLGYILATKKSIKLHKLTVIIGWLVAAAGALTLLFLVQPQIAGTGEPLTVPQVSVYWAFLRPGFALCVAWVVFACVYGYGGPVNWILSWSWFAPLARLTYCAYLVHISVMYMFYVTYDAKYHFSDSMLIFTFLSNLLATFLVSLLLSVLIEAPLLGLEKALISGTNNGKSQSQVRPVDVPGAGEKPLGPQLEVEPSAAAGNDIEMTPMRGEMTLQ